MASGKGVPAPRAVWILRMTPERWRKVQEVFAAATEREAGLRSAFLDEACRNDPELMREVESLLSSLGAAASGFLESPAIEGVPAISPTERAAPRSLRKGTRLGPYEILAAPWLRRDGRSLPSAGRAARARGGDQGAVGGAVSRRLPSEAVREGGAVGLGPEPPEHRHGLRLRVCGRPLVHRDGEGRRRDAEEARRRRPCPDQEAARDRGPDRPTVWPGRTTPGSCIGT